MPSPVIACKKEKKIKARLIYSYSPRIITCYECGADYLVADICHIENLKQKLHAVSKTLLSWNHEMKCRQHTISEHKINLHICQLHSFFKFHTMARFICIYCASFFRFHVFILFLVFSEQNNEYIIQKRLLSKSQFLGRFSIILILFIISYNQHKKNKKQQTTDWTRFSSSMRKQTIIIPDNFKKKYNIIVQKHIRKIKSHILQNQYSIVCLAWIDESRWADIYSRH